MKGILTLLNSMSRFISLGIAQLVRWLALFPFVLNTSSNPYFLSVRVVLIYLRRLFLSLLLFGCFGWQKILALLKALSTVWLFKESLSEENLYILMMLQACRTPFVLRVAKEGQVFD